MMSRKIKNILFISLPNLYFRSDSL